jgi:hypothetical protein
MVNLLGLAKSLIVNLGLQGKMWWLNAKDRRPDQIERADGAAKQIRDASPLELNSKTLEEWRALAGCFFLSVMYNWTYHFIPLSRVDTDKVARVFSTCEKTEPLKFAPHLEECCQRLATFREYESDKLLVQLVAIQRISLKISGLFNETNASFENSAMPLRVFIKSMQGELDDFKRNLPSELQQNRMSSNTFGGA